MSRRTPKHSRFIRIFLVVLHRKRYTLTISALLLMAMMAGVIYYDWEVEPVRIPAPRNWSQIVASDTLRVVTIPSSYTAFEYKGRWHGHEYENAALVAEALGLNLEVLTVESEQALADSLFAGAADMAITPMEHAMVEGHWFLRPAGLRWAEQKCLVAPRWLNVAVKADSLLMDSLRLHQADYRLMMAEGDSLTLEQRTDSMMRHRGTEALILRCNVARLMHDFYPTLAILDTITDSLDSLSWMVAAGADTLQQKIDSVAAEILENGAPHYTVTLKGYRTQRKHRARRIAQYVKTDGGLSPYDDIFRRKAAEADLDWRLLAGIAYVESNFRHDIVSRRGPIGLMQLMPQTVRSYGVDPEDALDPEVNVDLAVRLYGNVCRLICGRVPGIAQKDLMAFALAAYNAGLGHVYDAIRLAETLGYNPRVWEDNVEHCLRLKSDPQYYKMSVVKSGRFNGAFTINYVNEVTAAYQSFCAQLPQE